MDQASRLDPEELRDLLLECRLAQLSSFHLVVQLTALRISRYEVAEAVMWQAQAFAVGAQGGEEVGGDGAWGYSTRTFAKFGAPLVAVSLATVSVVTWALLSPG